MHKLIFNAKLLENINIEELQLQLKHNDANAMFNVGMMYHQGIKTEADPAKGIKWLIKATTSNHKDAAYNLGLIYLCGLGTSCNIRKGRDYLEKAAQNGAQVHALLRRIDNKYRSGNYADTEFDQALLEEHYNKQVVEKLAPKTFDIPLIISIIAIIFAMYLFITGLGHLNFGRALLGIAIGGGAFLFLKIRPYQDAFMDKSFKPKKVNTKELSTTFDERIMSLNPDDIENKASQNDAEALYMMGYMYYKGIHKAVDFNQAIQWFKKASMRRNSNAAYLLGIMTIKGEGITKNARRGFDLLETAANQNHKEAQAAVTRIRTQYKPSQLNSVDFDPALLEPVELEKKPLYKNPVIKYVIIFVIAITIYSAFSSSFYWRSRIAVVYMILIVIFIVKKMWLTK